MREGGKRKRASSSLLVFLLSRTFLLAPPNYIGEEARGRHPLLRIPDKIESKSSLHLSLSLSLSLSLCVCLSAHPKENENTMQITAAASLVNSSFTATVRGKSATTATASHFQNAQRHDNNRYQQRRKRNAFVITRANAQNNDDGKEENLFTTAEKLLEKAGVSMGPIAMSLQQDGENIREKSESFDSRKAIEEVVKARRKSIANLTTEEWEKKYLNKDGTVNLFMEDDFNIASRKAGAGDFDTLVNVENVAWQNKGSNEVDAPVRNVKITDHETGEVLELDVPEGRYILFEAEQQGWELANACRMGCCTKCAVKVTKGNLEQIQALGVSEQMRKEGYALLCVAHATSDIECVTQDEEEVYMKQFGEVFGKLATDKNAKSVVRDDFALEIADMDE